MSVQQVQKWRPMNSSELTELTKRRIHAAQNKPAVKVQAASEVTERIRKQAAQTLAITKNGTGKYNFYNGNSAENVTEVVAGRSYAASTRNAQQKLNTVGCCEPLPTGVIVQRQLRCTHPIPESPNIVRCRIPTNSKLIPNCALLPEAIQK